MDKMNPLGIAAGPLSGLREHPQRQRVNAEFHARPPLPLYGPTLVSHLTFLHEAGDGLLDQEHLGRLNADAGWQILEASEAYRLQQRDGLILRYELHTEFSSYTFFHPAPGASAKTALAAVPGPWLAGIPGQLVLATHIELESEARLAPLQKLAEVATPSLQMVVSRVVDGKGWVFTDFQIEDGASNFLLIDCGLTPRQAGRTVQRLWEIETYRVSALLGLPVAKAVALRLRGAEEQLADLMDRICSTGTAADESAVLDELTGLAAEVEHSVARTTFRFSASLAYEAIVMQRIGELREIRVEGFPTLREIMDRRLMPTMHTCAAMARRQDDLSGRVARNSQLLRTRVDLVLKRQNQLVLGQMNQRARLQMRLQETVEGLSVVAITYYGSQLVHHLAEAASTFWPQISPPLAAAVAIPLIALVLALGLRQMHGRLAAALSAE